VLAVTCWDYIFDWMNEPTDLTVNPADKEIALTAAIRNSTFLVCQCWVDLDGPHRDLVILKAESEKPLSESFQLMMMLSDGKTTFGYGSKSIYQSLLAIGIKWATFTSSETMLAMTKEEGSKEMGMN
jgi:hypothetical protein